jgi:hypothetical protein
MKMIPDYPEIDLFDNISQDKLDFVFNKEIFNTYVNTPINSIDELLYSIDDDEPITNTNKLLVSNMIM